MTSLLPTDSAPAVTIAAHGRPLAAIPEALQLAADELRKRSSELRALQGVHATANADLQSAKEKLSTSTIELQSAEASLATGQVANTGGARKTFFASRDGVDVCSARVAGLSPKIADAREAEVEARKKLEAAWREFSAGIIADYKAEYHAAVLQFFSVLDRGLAIGAALAGFPESDRLTYRIARQQILGLNSNDREYFRESHRIWEKHPEAVEFHAALVAERKRLFGKE
jgi:hypothetical protein